MCKNFFDKSIQFNDLVDYLSDINIFKVSKMVKIKNYAITLIS